MEGISNAQKNLPEFMLSLPVRSPLVAIVLALAIPQLLPHPVSGQGNHLFHPEPIEPGSIVGTAGVSVTFLPRSLVEAEIREAPLLDLRIRYGLPNQFSLEGGIRSNVFTNFIDLRGRYAFNLDPVFIGPSLRIGWWYGFAPFDGFDIRAASWLNYPGIDFGLKYDSIRFGATIEAQIITSLTIRTDGITTEETQNEVGGYALHLFLEQPFWGKTSTAIGLRVNYSKSIYQAWLAFSSFDEYLFYPEFTFGILF